MKKKFSRLTAAFLAVCTIVTASPAVSVVASAAGTAQSANVDTTMYISRSAYTFTKKNGKMVKGKVLKAGTEIKVKSSEDKYYLLDNGKYVLKDCVGTVRLYAPSTKAKNAGTGAKLSKSEGKVFNIYCYNEEFKGYFEKYYTVPEGVKVNWIVNLYGDGDYEKSLDEALRNQKKLPADERVDLFIVDPDYIRKYVDSDYTMDVSKIGVKPYTTEYEYSYTAAMDSKGALKGVSYLLSPGALIYRRSIAKKVLGTSDPDKVQKKLDTWEEFNSVAKKAKEMGYYMTASYEETYRVFTCNSEKPVVNSKNKLSVTSEMESWLSQAEEFVKNDYTISNSIWTAEWSKEMSGNGKTMCFFGPSWFYNFVMASWSWDYYNSEKSNMGDWAICQGPEPYFWGGTWLLAASGSDNPQMIADVMNAFTANPKICKKLVEEEGLFVNNTTVNSAFSKSDKAACEFLGGQNDWEVLINVAKKIKYDGSTHTVYDTDIYDYYKSCMLDYLRGYVTKKHALGNFYQCLASKIPEIKLPKFK